MEPQSPRQEDPADAAAPADPAWWRERFEQRRSASRAARGRQQRVVVAIIVALVILLVALLGLGPALSGRPVILSLGGGPPGAAKPSPAPHQVTPRPSAGPPDGSRSSAPSAVKPTSVIAFGVTPRAFTPSTIGNPFGDFRFIRETKVRVATRRAVKLVKIVALPPPVYTSAEAQAAGAGPVPATMVYKGRLEQGVQLIPWTGQTKEGYALPRGIYRVRLTVLSDSTDPRDVGRSVEATAELVSFVTIGNRTSKVVALTIDDGWNADPRIFNLLKREAVPATAFFIAGRGVADRNPELVRTAMRAGMEIANHSLEHAWLLRLTDTQVMRQARGGQAVLEPLAGYNHRWFRPSGGAMDLRTMRALYAAGHVPVQWSVDTEDTNRRRSVDERVATTLGAVRRLGSGTIILCHFGGHNTYELLTRVIPEIKAMGYAFGTMSQVMAGTPGFTAQGPLPAMVAPDPPE